MKQASAYISLVVLIIFASCNNVASTAKANTDDKGFGDSIPLSNGLTGKIFLLPENTDSLPNFDTMKSLDHSIYTSTVDVALQSWSLGFPGLPERIEWFGIEYTCFFKTDTTGNYTFRLLSDDGSKLFIDNTLIINNDGLHSAVSKSGNIFLNNSVHEAKILYFQGPRYQLALQLFWSLNNSKEQIFPGSNFILFTQKKSENKWWWILAGVVLIIIALFFNKSKKSKAVR